MSGSKVLAFPQTPDPLEEKLRIEDDRRLLGCAGSAAVLAAPWIAWALTVQIMLPPIPVDPGSGGKGDPGFTVVRPPVDYHGSIREKRVAKRYAKPGQAGHKAPVPKTAHPTDNPGWLGQNVVTSRGQRDGLSAYDLLRASLKHVDMDKIAELPMLRRTAESRIAGRRGRESHEFNFEYSEQGTGCAADCGPGALPELPRLDPSGPRPARVSGSKATAIDYAAEDNARSSASILAVIRAHAPGLRHVYNGWLKRMPGLTGKLTLAFSIAPSGAVVELAVASSTTRAPGFDAEIARQAKSWRFEPVRAAGNDHVTVPLTFSE
jgi:TonB family protein